MVGLAELAYASAIGRNVVSVCGGSVAVGVAVLVAVAVSVGVAVIVAVLVTVAVSAGVAVSVGVEVIVRVLVGVAGSLAVAVAVGVGIDALTMSCGAVAPDSRDNRLTCDPLVLVRAMLNRPFPEIRDVTSMSTGTPAVRAPVDPTIAGVIAGALA